MAPFWEFRVHSEPNPHPQLGRKPRPSALLIPEPVDPPPTPRPLASQPPRPSAPLPKFRTESLWFNEPPLFLSSHPVAPIAEPAASFRPSSLAPPPAPRPAQGRKPRQRPPRQPKLWDLLPELPPAPRPYRDPQPSSGDVASAPLAHLHGQPFAPPFWQPAPRNPSRQVSIGFPTAGAGDVIDLSTWGSVKTAARGVGTARRGERPGEIPQIRVNSSAGANVREKRDTRQLRNVAESKSVQVSQTRVPLVSQSREGSTASSAAAPIAAREASSQLAPDSVCRAAVASSFPVKDFALSAAAPSLDLARSRQHRDSCTCSVDYASLWGSLLSAAAEVALVVGDVASLIAPQSPTPLTLTSSAGIPPASAIGPTVTSIATLTGKGVGLLQDSSPSSVLQNPASAKQLQGEPHARQWGPHRRARQLKIWDLQPELPPAPHLRHDRALEREFAQQLRNLPPELPPASQPDAGLPEAPPSSDGACGVGAPGRSGLCSPDNGGLCGTAHCARCDWLSRPKLWPSIGFPVRRSAQLAQQAERAAHPVQRFDGLADRRCSDPATQPAWQAFPAYYPTGSADPVIPADPTYFPARHSAELPRQQQPPAPHSPPIDEPAPFRAGTDGFLLPPCAFTSTPADLPLKTPRASRSVAEPWGGTAELVQTLGGGGLVESGAVLAGDWRKLPPPGWYRRLDWGMRNARNAIRGVSVRASSAAVTPLPAPTTAQRAPPMTCHASSTAKSAVQSSSGSITRMHSDSTEVPAESERSGNECAAVEADPRSKSHRATCLPISGEAIQTHVASFWLTVLGQLEFLGEVSSALLGEAVPGGRNRQERGEEWSGKQAGSSVSGLSHSYGREQTVGPAAAPVIGGSDGEILANATAAMQAPILSLNTRCRDFSRFNVSGLNTDGPTDAGRPTDAGVCGTTTVILGNFASPPFDMGPLQPLPMASSFQLGEVLSATHPGQGITAKNRTEPGRPYLRVRSMQLGRSTNLDTCCKGTGHSPASILDSPVPSDDSGCDSRPELTWGQSTLSLGY
ncbi:unnamed protein product [Closterium sp. Naga37s-1]|nr:unnamed protein product [Closterium sp. Naga37s-1]